MKNEKGQSPLEIASVSPKMFTAESEVVEGKKERNWSEFPPSSPLRRQQTNDKRRSSSAEGTETVPRILRSSLRKQTKKRLLSWETKYFHSVVRFFRIEIAVSLAEEFTHGVRKISDNAHWKYAHLYGKKVAEKGEEVDFNDYCGRGSK